MGKWAIKREVERATWEPSILGGVTIAQLAKQRGVSRQRVCQKLKTLGLLEKYQSVQGIAKGVKRAQKDESADARCMERWGCDLATRREINRERAGIAYSRQRENAKRRGIPWEMSLGQWWGLWKESGQWKNRGIFKGQYCMSRFGDEGPYAPNNVAIIPNADNSREARTHSKKSPITGVYCVHPGTSKPWVAYVKKKSIGYFESDKKAEEARTRRLAELDLASQ